MGEKSLRETSSNAPGENASVGAAPPDVLARQAGPDDKSLARRLYVSRLPASLQSCLRALASLQLAIALIVAFVVVLAGATFIEKQYGSAAAHAMVYGTAWFAAVHAALAVNVLFAMLIRLPWQRRQIGFLLTHAGILVLLAGCAVTRVRGIDARLSIYEGHANCTAKIVRPEEDGDDEKAKPLELGFQVYLRQFRRRLDPGSQMPSYYSSRVDFLERSDPPKPPEAEKKLQEDVLITLNAPVDFTDPKTGRGYRFFQASFPELWLPGDAEFDKLAGNDRRRDQICLSVLSLNYDPGRRLKYLGSLMIVVGIAAVYYRRGGRAANPLAVSPAPPTGTLLRGLFFAAVALPLLAGSARVEAESLDWATWRCLPVLCDGRVAPLDTFARRIVGAICGRTSLTVSDPGVRGDGRPREFSAAELLLAWLAEPTKWENVAFLPADDEQLRRAIGLPLEDAGGRRLHYVSPCYVKQSGAIRSRLAEIMHRAEVEGKAFRMTDVDKKLDRLIDAYGSYRAWTDDPRCERAAPRRFVDRARLANDALYRLRNDRVVARRTSKETEIRQSMVQVTKAWGGVLQAMHGGEFSLKKIEPAVAEFRRSADHLASRLRSAHDAVATALAANLQHQAAQMHLALYDDDECLRLVPALDAGALEENRTPEDDASPWLGFQALIYGSDDLMRAYPRPQLMRVREAFAKLKAAYVDRTAGNRAAVFSAAMNELAQSLRSFATAVEPLRQELPLRHRDRELIAATAYPRPGSTAAEVFYNRLDPFFWSWTVSLAAVLCLLVAVGRWRKPLFGLGAATLVAAAVVAIAGMGLRWRVTGFVPLTGMFETVEFVALYAGLLGLWFAMSPVWRGVVGTEVPTSSSRVDLVMERRLFVLAGAIVSFTAAVLAYYAPATVMHRNIGAIMPILRDNRWLAVHVVTIMASYASAAIALILGLIALGYYLFGRYRDKNGIRRPPQMCRVLAGFIYTAIKITVLLLAAGTILGALWADSAWGRFWSWDPKEVWALVSLLVYLLVLHLRHIILRARSLDWSGDFLMAVAAVFGFTAVVFTWYFVNFVLGTGMHSYGSGSGGTWAVTAAIAATWLFLFAAAARHLFEIAGRRPSATQQCLTIGDSETPDATP